MPSTNILVNQPKHILSPATLRKYHPKHYYTVVIKVKNPPTDDYTDLNLLIIPKESSAHLPLLTYVKGPIGHYTQTDITVPYSPKEIDSVIVTPQSGKWELDEFILKPETATEAPLVFRSVYSSHSPYLEPLAPFTPLSPEVKAKYDQEYVDLKRMIMETAVKTTVLGTVACYFLTTHERALAYGLGGMLGVVYASLLQRSIDRIIPSATNTPNTNYLDTLARQLAVAVVAASTLTHYKTAIAADHTIFFFALAGFFATRAGYF